MSQRQQQMNSKMDFQASRTSFQTMRVQKNKNSLRNIHSTKQSKIKISSTMKETMIHSNKRMIKCHYEKSN